MTARTSTRRLVLAVAGALLLLAAGTGVYAATRPPSFRLTVETGVRTFAPGQPTGFAIGVERIRGFDREVRLNLSDLPEGVRVAWRLPDGRALPRHPKRTSGAVLPPNARLAYAIVYTSRATKPGVYRPLITAGGGAIKRRMRKKLIVAPVRLAASSERETADSSSPGLAQAIAAEPRTVSVVAAPASRRIVQTEDAAFSLDLGGNAADAAELSASGLPAGAKATFSGTGARRTLTVATDRSTATGTYDVTVTARSGDASSAAAATLVVLPFQRFTMTGGLSSPLALGQSEPLGMTLTNPYDFDLKVTALDVTVSTDQAGCDADENFDVRQVDLTEPLVLPPGVHAIEDLVADKDHRAQVTWPNLPDVNQDACVGAPVDLAFTGVATR